MTRSPGLTICSLLFLWTTVPAAGEVPVANFFRHVEYESIQISPDGKNIAATVPEETGRALVILRREDRKVLSVARFTDDRDVSSFSWISKSRVAFTITDRVGSLVAPIPRGELFFMRVDGKDRAGYAGGKRITRLVARLQDIDDEAFVIDNVPSQRREEDDAFLYRVNPRSGKGQLIAQSPVPNATFLVDVLDGTPVMAWGSRGHRASEVHTYNKESKEWRQIYSERESGQVLRPLGMHPDGVRFYAALSEPQGPDGLYLVSVDGSRELVIRDEVSNPTGFQSTLDSRALLAVDFGAATPKRHYLLPKHPDAVLLKALERSFPGQRVNFINATLDRSLVVFIVSGDTNPGDFYLYDQSTKKAEYMASRAQWIDPESMASMQKVQFAARDDTIIHGWLTVPKGQDPKNLPLIVMPHGGPHGVYDGKSFNSEVQLLASRGYAVLQPNYRGSGGFGRAFEEAGYREWGQKMQDDVTDATQWAIAEGIADRDRICLVGASYGAYAALMGVVREPSLYKCAAGFFGVYDLDLWFRRGDAKDSSFGVNYLEEVIGNDKSRLAQQSPAYLVNKIQVPLMIVAGEKDRRTPPVQSTKLVDALNRADKGSLVKTFFVQKGEGHGFYSVDNNVMLYTKLLEFLDSSFHRESENSAP